MDLFNESLIVPSNLRFFLHRLSDDAQPSTNILKIYAMYSTSASSGVLITCRLPMALVGSISSIAGALAGLAMPANVVQLLLGLAIMGIAALMMKARAYGSPDLKEPDALSKMLQISGIYYEESTKSDVSWQIHRTPLGLFLFMIIGFIGGMFGMGAGWANVPVFNMLMGVPLKVAVATSGLVLSINGAAAAWVYIFKGAVVPLIAVPAIGGIMLGSKIGAKLLTKVNTRSVRMIVIIMLVVAGLRSLLKGFGI